MTIHSESSLVFFKVIQSRRLPSRILQWESMPYPDDIPFLPGLDLCERFYVELIQPLLDQHYPSLEYAACRLGPGSDVLGFDTAQSRDHDWGPKLDILLDNETHIVELIAFFARHLRGKSVAGYSTQFQPFSEQDGQVTLINVAKEEEGRTCHGVRVMTTKTFFREYLNWSIDQSEPTCQDWLTFPSQHLLTIARGRVFHDSASVNLQRIRAQLSAYPNDVWLYLIGCCWQRIGQEEHLMGRAGQAGDELGSALIANRILRDIMRLLFLLEKQFYPYSKWFGTAFRRWTSAGSDFEPLLRQIQLAPSWQEREEHLSEAYRRLTRLFNEKFFQTSTGLIDDVSQFHGRPFQVINGGSIAERIFAQIEDDQVRQLPKIGSTDLFIDSTDALSAELRLRMQRIFQ